MSKKSKNQDSQDKPSDAPDKAAEEAKPTLSDVMVDPKETEDVPAAIATAGADGPLEVEARSEVPQGADKADDEAPKSLEVTSKNVTDMRVATLAQRLACGKAEALGAIVCLYLSAAEGLLPKIDRAHLDTWAVHSGFSDLRRNALWDALTTSGWVLKGKDKKWALAPFDATRQINAPAV